MIHNLSELSDAGNPYATTSLLGFTALHGAFSTPGLMQAAKAVLK